MNNKTQRHDQAFTEQQRKRLVQLREAALGATQSGQDEENEIREQSAGQAGEYEDGAQKLVQLEIDGNLVQLSLQRLPAIERALKKIEEGTYGLSDSSGKLIPRARLEAVPEAVHTVDEEASLNQQP